MKGKIRKIFPGANTSNGFYSYFDYIIPKDVKRIFCLKGGPGVGKSSLMKKIAREFADMTFHLDCRSRLHEMTVPSVILQCAEDSIVPGPIGHYLHEHLPHSSFEILDVKGHYPHISHPEVTIERLKHYIKEG